MNQQDKDRIQMALVGAWQVFHPGKPFPIETQRAYLQALQCELTVEEIAAACKLSMTRFRFFPKPVELIELAKGCEDSVAEAAWSQVVYAIESYGGYKSVEFDDPRISVAINNCGGWQNFCERPETWSKQHFISAYRGLPANIEPVRLIGIHDQNNRRYRPKRIGGTKQPRIESQNVARELAAGIVRNLETSNG